MDEDPCEEWQILAARKCRQDEIPIEFRKQIIY